MQRCNLWFCLPYPKAEEERPGSGPDEPWGCICHPQSCSSSINAEILSNNCSVSLGREGFRSKFVKLPLPEHHGLLPGCTWLEHHTLTHSHTQISRQLQQVNTLFRYPPQQYIFNKNLKYKKQRLMQKREIKLGVYLGVCTFWQGNSLMEGRVLTWVHCKRSRSAQQNQVQVRQ